MIRELAIVLCIVPLAAAADSPPVAATVNGHAIPLAEVDALLKRVKSDAPIAAAQLSVLRRAVLDELVDEVLLKHYLSKKAVPLDSAEVEQHLHALAEVQKSLGKTLADFTRETGLSESRLRDSLATMLRWQKHVHSLAREEDYRRHFDENRDAFEGATVRASHILIRPGNSDGELAAATVALARLKTDLEAGTITFAAAARKHSICPTAAAGGDLGTFGRRDGLVEEEIAAAAFALPEGAISKPVRSAAGLHLVKVVKRTAGKSVRYEEVKPAVVESYAEEARQRLLVELRASADLRIALP